MAPPIAGRRSWKSIEERIFDPQRSVRCVGGARGDLACALLAPLAVDSLILGFADRLFGIWRAVFAGALRWARLPAEVTMEPSRFPAGWRVRMPCIEILAGAPSPVQWAWILYALAMAWLATRLLPERWMPLTYALRFLCVVQLTSVVFFAVWPGRFPYGVDDFVRTQVCTGFVFLLLIPPVYGMSYLILDFSLWRKLALLLISVTYVGLAAPVQIVTCAILTYFGSLALIPLFYLALGPLVYVSWMVAFYSWGVSWRPRGDPA